VGCDRGEEKRSAKRRYIEARVNRLDVSRGSLPGSLNKIAEKYGVNSLLPPKPSPESDHDIDRSESDDRLPSVRPPIFAGFSNPAQGDETIVQPVELEQNSEQERSGSMDEDGIHGSSESLGVLEQGQVDRKASRQLAGSNEDSLAHTLRTLTRISTSATSQS
jgi:hypothetical protein